MRDQIVLKSCVCVYVGHDNWLRSEWERERAPLKSAEGVLRAFNPFPSSLRFVGVVCGLV